MAVCIDWGVLFVVVLRIRALLFFRSGLEPLILETPIWHLPDCNLGRLRG